MPFFIIVFPFSVIVFLEQNRPWKPYGEAHTEDALGKGNPAPHIRELHRPSRDLGHHPWPHLAPS